MHYLVFFGKIDTLKLDPSAYSWKDGEPLCHNPSFVKECEDDDSHSQVSSHCEGSSPDGLPNLQRAIAEVKTPQIEEFFISLEKY